MTVRFAAAARRDIDAILSYLAARNAQAARAVSEAIEATAALAGDYPQAGRIIYRGVVRSLLVGRYPYKLIYVDRGAPGITILRSEAPGRSPCGTMKCTNEAQHQ